MSLGTDLDGTPFSTDATKLQRYKMIPPTYLYVKYDADSFRGSEDFRIYKLTGNKYVEAFGKWI